MRYVYDAPDTPELLADLQRYYDTVIHFHPNGRKVLGLKNFFGPKPEGHPHAFFVTDDGTYGEPAWSRDLYEWLLRQGYEFNERKLPKDVQRHIREHGGEPAKNYLVGRYPQKRSPK